MAQNPWAFRAVTGMEHQEERIMSIILGLLFLVLVSLLLFGNNTPLAVNLIKAMILLEGVVWGLLRLGHFELSKLMAIILGNLLILTMVFNGWSGGDPYKIYGITMFHLFLLFISSQITNNIIYAFISTGFASVSIVLHYFIFALPGKNKMFPLEPKHYTICLGLILISFIVIKKTLAYRSRLIEKAEKESNENFEKTRQLEFTNKKLLASYHETRKADENYRILVETAMDAIFITQEGIIKFLNQRTVDMLGYSKGALLEKSFHGLVHPDYREIILEKHGSRMAKATPGGSDSLKIITKNGDVLWGQLNRGFILWEDKPATLNYLRDITKEKEIQAKNLHARKMEIIGNLAGGIAHDFNNILSGIFGYSQLAKNNLDNPERASRHIDHVILAGQKAAETVQQILTVSRQTKNEKYPVKISLVVKEALNLLCASMPSTIEIKKDLFLDKFVLADPTKIHQVVMNLCTNAYHAMFETGGILSVRLKEIEVCDQARGVETSLSSGNYLVLEVSDTGHGMDSETRQKIFDPYFTTKGNKEGSQKGTGLGLALVLGIVEEHNGYIKVSSEPGNGSSFHVYLPVAEKNPGAKEPEKKEIIEGGTERIMVVDDEKEVLFSIQYLLKDYGYKVDIFKNGLEAFEAFERAPDSFDLIITDMTMPLMTGLTLAKKVLEKRPGQQIFLCTGYSENINREKALSIGIFSYFEKPLIMNDLLKEIRSCFKGRISI